MPADYYEGVGKDAYVKALDSEKGIFNPTGMMPADGPKTCLAVLGGVQPEGQGQDDRPGQDLHQRVRQGCHPGQLTRRGGAPRPGRSERSGPARPARKCKRFGR